MFKRFAMFFRWKFRNLLKFLATLKRLYLPKEVHRVIVFMSDFEILRESRAKDILLIINFLLQKSLSSDLVVLCTPSKTTIVFDEHVYMTLFKGFLERTWDLFRSQFQIYTYSRAYMKCWSWVDGDMCWIMLHVWIFRYCLPLKYFWEIRGRKNIVCTGKERCQVHAGFIRSAA